MLFFYEKKYRKLVKYGKIYVTRGELYDKFYYY